MSDELWKALVHCFMEFYDVFIHSILHANKIYPSWMFNVIEKYGLKLYVCFYEQVLNYVNEFLQKLNSLLIKKYIKRIDLLIINKVSKIIRSYKIELNILENLSKVDYDYLSSEVQVFFYDSLVRILCTEYSSIDVGENTFNFVLIPQENYINDLRSYIFESNKDDPFWINFENNFINNNPMSTYPMKTIDQRNIKLQFYMEY